MVPFLLFLYSVVCTIKKKRSCFQSQILSPYLIEKTFCSCKQYPVRIKPLFLMTVWSSVMKIWLLLHLAWKRGVAGGRCSSDGKAFVDSVCAVITPSVAFCLFCDGLSQQCFCNKGSSHCFSQCALLSQEQQQRTSRLIKAIALCHFYIVVYLSSLTWIHITANKKIL